MASHCPAGRSMADDMHFAASVLVPHSDDVWRARDADARPRHYSRGQTCQRAVYNIQNSGALRQSQHLPVWKYEMTHQSFLPEPPNWGAPNLLRSLIAASLAATALAAMIGTVAYTWPGKTSRAQPNSPPLHARTVVQDDVAAEGFSWGWPAGLVDATGMFQCGPANRDTAVGTVVVWTNGANNVVAFASSLEGLPLPAYASALRGNGAGDAGQSIQVADRRHAVQPAGERHALRLESGELVCTATWDD